MSEHLASRGRCRRGAKDGKASSLLLLYLRVVEEIERWMGLFQGAKPLVGGGHFRDARTNEEGLGVFHDSCGSKKRGIVAVLGLMMGTPVINYEFASTLSEEGHSMCRVSTCDEATYFYTGSALNLYPNHPAHHQAMIIST